MWKYLIGIFLSLGRVGQTLQVRMGTMMAAVLLMIMILPMLTGNLTGLKQNTWMMGSSHTGGLDNILRFDMMNHPERQKSTTGSLSMTV